MLKRVTGWLLGVIAIALAVLLVLYIYRVPIGEHLASAALDRDVTIGSIELDPGFVTRLDARDIRVANARWDRSGTPFAGIGRLMVAIDLAATLSSRRLDLPLIELEDGDVRLVFDPEHGANFAGMIASRDPDADARSAPLIGRLALTRIGFTLSAADAELDLAGSIEARDGSEAGLAVAAQGSGTLRERDVTFLLALGGLDAWQRRAEGYPLRAALTSTDTTIEIDGTIAAPLALSGYRFEVRFAGPDTAALGALTALPLPDLPPYDVRVRIADESESVIGFERLSGRFGDSDLAGKGRYELGAERPRLEADLVSKRLDLDDLAGLIGAPPDSGPGETASTADRAADERRDARATVIPSTPLKLGQLQRANMQLHYRAAAIDTPHVPLADLDMTVMLEAGRLSLQPLRVALGGGEFAADFSVDQSGAVALAGELERVSLKAILRDLELTNEAAGTLSGQFDVTARGRSVGEWFSELNGDINLLTAGGRFDSVLTELLGLDAGEALVAHLSDSERVEIHCGAITTTAVDGKLNFNRLVIDTSDAVIRGNGFIALGDERYALQLKAKPKDFSLFSGDAPIYVKGSFKQPEVSPDIAETLLSLLTPIEFGEATDIDCAALLPQRNARN